MVLPVKTKRNSEPQTFPCPVSAGSLPHSAVGPHFLYSSFYHLCTHRKPSQLLMMSLYRLFSIWISAQMLPLYSSQIICPCFHFLYTSFLCWVCSGDPSSSINTSWYFWLTFWCRSGLRTIKSKTDKVFSKWSTQQCNPWLINSQNYAHSF